MHKVEPHSHKELEVLIEKGSAAVNCELQIGQRQFVEQLNI